MMKKIIVFFLFVVVGITAVELPSEIKICKLNDPFINKCLTETVKKAIDVLAKGNEELNLDSFDPLNVDRIVMKDNNNAASLSHELLNLTISGLSNNTQVTVKNFDSKPNTLSFFLEVFIPRLDIVGNYTMDGKILLLPIYGQGKCELTLSNMVLTSNIKNDIYEKNGEKYLKNKKVIPHIKKVDIKVYLENILNGDPTIGKEMNKLLNDNIQSVFNDFKPAYEKIFKNIISKNINTIFQQIPFYKLFPLD